MTVGRNVSVNIIHTIEHALPFNEVEKFCSHKDKFILGLNPLDFRGVTPLMNVHHSL